MKNNRYILFWLSQSFSQLGSAMTAYALILWVYGRSGSALAVSLMTFCSYLPYAAASLFSGAFVDRHSKKAVLLGADTLAAVCTLAILALAASGRLEVGWILAANVLTGLMNAFQSPAAAVAVGVLAPEGRIANVSGMNAFSANLTGVVSPILAAALYGAFGLPTVLAIDLLTFVTAFFVLLLWIRIPEPERKAQPKAGPFAGFLDGWRFLRRHGEILLLVETIAVINFFSRLTYENILSPMLLARSGSALTLSMVTSVMGAGGIVGGLLVSLRKKQGDPARLIYGSAALSFLLGDLGMALGRGGIAWALAGIAASLPIPFITAGQDLLFYSRVPRAMQGRVFAVRNALQYSTIPLGILLGGWLADRIFEPMMASNSPLAGALSVLVGAGAGSGMAVMFLCTGLCGSLCSLWGWSRMKRLTVRYEVPNEKGAENERSN